MIEFSLKKRLHTSDGAVDLQVDMSVEDGDFISLYGRSGAGKTTVLRMLAGLTAPDAGFIKVNDEYWYNADKGINLSPQRRRVGMMFQDYALFPNMTVRGNLEYAVRDRRDRDRIDDILQVTDLTRLQHRHPDLLSGGQKQRVALARALVSNPGLLLLDEPLSALEWEMRHRLQEEITTAHKKFGLTTIMVSHDVSEIIRLSDQIYRIDAGKITAAGKAKEVFKSAELGAGLSFTGEVREIRDGGGSSEVTLLTGEVVIRLVLSTQQAADMKIGDNILVSATAVNPTVTKVDNNTHIKQGSNAWEHSPARNGRG